MNFKLIIVLNFIFLIPFISSINLSISPTEINFVGETGETICQTINIKVTSLENLTATDFWAEQEYSERNLKKHNKNASELGLSLIYLKEFEINNTKELSICISGENSGNYHGILLYKIKEKPAQIGIWMNVNLEKEKRTLITGNIINEKENLKEINYLVPSLFLLIVLIYLLIIKKKKNYSNNS